MDALGGSDDPGTLSIDQGHRERGKAALTPTAAIDGPTSAQYISAAAFSRPDTQALSEKTRIVGLLFALHEVCGSVRF